MRRSLIATTGLIALGCAHSAKVVQNPVTLQSAPTYQVIDLMPRFFAFWDSAGGRSTQMDSLARIRLFRQVVIQPESAFFAGAVPLAGGPDSRVPMFLTRVPNDVAAIRALSAQLPGQLRGFQRSFLDSFPDFEYRGRVYFYPSLYVRDGGTFGVNGQSVLGFGVDMIARLNGPNAKLGVLFHHELFHLYHGQVGPRSAGRAPLWRQMWTEGLATYVSGRLHPEASLVDVLLQDSVLARNGPMNIRAIAADALANIDDTTAAVGRAYFQTSGQRPEIPGRAGYYLGFLAATELGKRHTVRDLARFGGDSLRAAIRSELESLTRTGPGR